ncbi:MAG TPA: DUF3570 domain-containing protein [Steroidobacteraceae bacterium]|nr:DUF3570 domain-containing protein [Steroidobacteraceae bacterium]
MQLTGISGLRAWLPALCGLLAAPTIAGVLPEDRADLLYHRYDGGGVVIDGPSVLVRKGFADKVSVSANYYVDMVSSASIDVVTTASPYEEERTQYSLTADYLRGKSTYSIGYINSSESDFEAATWYAGVSQDMFGDLTTISFSFKKGDNDIYRNIGGAKDPTFTRASEVRSYAVGLTQVLTRSMIGQANFEVITDEGFLNSPYRSVRYVDPGSPNGYSYQPEVYPATRTSNAASLRLSYYLPWRAALEGWYRFYTDSWGIDAHTAEVSYTHPMWQRWIFSGSVRYYTQEKADFYADLFPRRDYANFLARDKELSTFTAVTLGVGASYDFSIARLPWIDKAQANVRYDFMTIDYDDFLDVRETVLVPGTESPYSLDANIFQVFLSIWF